MKNDQKTADFNKKTAIIKGLISIGFFVLCVTFIGKYAYPVMMGVRLVGMAITKQG